MYSGSSDHKTIAASFAMHLISHLRSKDVSIADDWHTRELFDFLIDRSQAEWDERTIVDSQCVKIRTGNIEYGEESYSSTTLYGRPSGKITTSLLGMPSMDGQII